MEDTRSEEIQHSTQPIGSRIKTARGKKGMSIEELSASLHISEKILVAIEEGRQLEGIAPVFMRGFIRSYAQHMEVWDENLEQQMRKTLEIQEVPIKPVFQRLSFPKRKSSRFRRILFFLALGSAGYLVYALFYFSPPSPEFVAETLLSNAEQNLSEPGEKSIESETLITKTNQHQKETTTEEIPAPAKKVINPMPAELPGPEADSGLTDAEPLTADAEMTYPTPGSKPDAGFGADEGTTEVESPEVPVATEENLHGDLKTDLLPPVMSPMKLVISATERTWISIALDDEPYMDVQFEAGESYEWETNRQYLLTLGNAAVVHLLLDGRELEFDRSRSLLTDWGIRTDSRIE